jgi:hypothetical protein
MDPKPEMQAVCYFKSFIHGYHSNGIKLRAIPRIKKLKKAKATPQNIRRQKGVTKKVPYKL